MYILGLPVLTHALMLSRNAQTRQLSHPLPVLRAREIDEWSRSQDYKTLLNQATQIAGTKKGLTTPGKIKSKSIVLWKGVASFLCFISTVLVLRIYSLTENLGHVQKGKKFRFLVSDYKLTMEFRTRTINFGMHIVFYFRFVRLLCSLYTLSFSFSFRLCSPACASHGKELGS